MQYIDNREDQEVIDMVNRNHRLNVEVTRTVGYIVPVEEARRIAAQRQPAAGQHRGRGGCLSNHRPCCRAGHCRTGRVTPWERVFRKFSPL